MNFSGGANANYNGDKHQRMVREILIGKGYIRSNARTLEDFKAAKYTLYPAPGQWCEQCRVPLVSPYHQGRNRAAVVDCLVHSNAGDFINVSLKSQQVNGSAEQKLEFEIQQLIATELPSAMLVIGPVKGRDGPEGWSPDVLGEIWERTRHFGSSRILLFRTIEEKFMRWINAGTPVGGRGRTISDVFAEFCDREP